MLLFFVLLTPALRFWLFLSLCDSHGNQHEAEHRWDFSVTSAPRCQCSGWLRQHPIVSETEQSASPHLWHRETRQSAALVEISRWWLYFDCWTIETRVSCPPTLTAGVWSSPVSRKSHRGLSQHLWAGVQELWQFIQIDLLLVVLSSAQCFKELCFTLKPHNSHTFWNVS